MYWRRYRKKFRCAWFQLIRSLLGRWAAAV